MPTKFPDIFSVQTTDFFYPLVDDPYMQGKIGCANVLSDLYAMGISDCDNMLMILAASRNMESEHRDIVTREMIRGFNDLAIEAGTRVTGGQTVINPWPIIGGVATSVQKTGDFVVPENAVAGDLIVLTKPLGTQVAVNVNQWMRQQNNWWEKVKDSITPEEVTRSYEVAGKSMARLNRNGAKMMIKHGAHAGTDVTGFGILGHLENLAKAQKANVILELHTLPMIRSMVAIDDIVKLFKVKEGYSAETSGGLMVCVPAANAEQFVKDMKELDGEDAWIIGRVLERPDGEPGSKHNIARITDDCKLLDV